MTTMTVPARPFPPIYLRRASDRDVPSNSLPRRTILQGDAAVRLRDLPDGSVDCVITSPPYFLLRDYGTLNQIGLEGSVDEWVSRLLGVTAELARVLKPTGSFYLNVSDSYARHQRYGAPTKSLLLGPERLLLRLLDQGWIVRNKLVWSKPNPLPASVRDRLSCTWEPLYLLTRSPRYYFDLDAIREPHRTQRKPAPHTRPGKYEEAKPKWAGPLAGSNNGLLRARAEGRSGHPLGKNPGDVWTIPTAGYRGAHFATFPAALLTKPILASCPPGGVVLDPFMGAGTVAIEAERLGRDWLGIELNPAYRRQALRRIAAARKARGA